jgi:hypothetical protein
MKIKKNHLKAFLISAILCSNTYAYECTPDNLIKEKNLIGISQKLYTESSPAKVKELMEGKILVTNKYLDTGLSELSKQLGWSDDELKNRKLLWAKAMNGTSDCIYDAITSAATDFKSFDYYNSTTSKRGEFDVSYCILWRALLYNNTDNNLTQAIERVQEHGKEYEKVLWFLSVSILGEYSDIPLSTTPKDIKEIIKDYGEYTMISTHFKTYCKAIDIQKSRYKSYN